ncbi:MAG: hypothetical protein JWR15_1607 [Prosthecobacter sp.]|nr:hypothetical protein [Prosthecobacter sp.]
MSNKVGLILIAAGISSLLWVAFDYMHSLPYLRRAREDRPALWMAAAKGFNGPVHYYGDEGGNSFFRSGVLYVTTYRSPTSKVHPPKMFPLGEQAAYQITLDMVPPYP